MPRLQPPSRHIPRASEPSLDPVALSVVLPCYRASALARQSVVTLAAALTGRLPSWEIIVVDDGGHDCASAVGTVASPADGRIRVVTLPANQGKGSAVRAGMLAASGDVRVFTDVDIPYGCDPILLVENLIRTRRFHLVIGDRTFRQSRYETDIPFGRRLASSVFSTITATLVTGGFFDTQCGLKGVRGDVADALFGLQRVERFAFDVELIYLALKYGLEIKRIPVVLESNMTSSVRLGRDAVRTLIDVGRIKYNQVRGNYASDFLADMVANECRSVTDAIPAASAPAARASG